MSKARALLELARAMQDSRSGLSLFDIQQRFGVARRTAERMRNAVMRIFPVDEKLSTSDRIKRWHIPTGRKYIMFAPSSEELISLDAAIVLMRRENFRDHVLLLSGLVTKMRFTTEHVCDVRTET